MGQRFFTALVVVTGWFCACIVLGSAPVIAATAGDKLRGICQDSAGAGYLRIVDEPSGQSGLQQIDTVNAPAVVRPVALPAHHPLNLLDIELEPLSGAQSTLYLLNRSEGTIELLRADYDGDRVSGLSLLLALPGEGVATASVLLEADQRLRVTLFDARSATSSGFVLRLETDGSVPVDNAVVRTLVSSNPYLVARVGGSMLADSSAQQLARALDPQLLSGADEALNHSLDYGVWQLISWPQALPAGATVATVLADDIEGRYGYDWAVFGLDADAQRYHLVGLESELSPDQGYWIIQYVADQVLVDLPPDSHAVRERSGYPCAAGELCYGIEIIAQDQSLSWNSIGFPFSEQRSLAGMTISGAGCEPRCAFDQQPGHRLVYPQLWYWDEQLKRYQAVTPDDVLLPWHGYWAVAMEAAGDSTLWLSRSLGGLEPVTDALVITEDNTRVSGKHFYCSGSPYQAVVVAADNVTISDSLFSGCYAGIIIAGHSGTTIINNRFDAVGAAIREKTGSRDTSVRYNEFYGVGTKDCTLAPEYGASSNGYWNCAVFQSVNGRDAEFSFNQVDNRQYSTRFLEDFVNLYGSGSGFVVSDNVFVGSAEADSASASGGCIVLDGPGLDYRILRNQCLNTAGYGIGSAGGSDALIQNNRVYLSKQHTLALGLHPHNSQTTAGSAGISSTGFNGECGKNVKVYGNEVYAYHARVSPGNRVEDTGGAWLNFYAPEPCEFITSNSLPNSAYSDDPAWDVSGDLSNLSVAEYFTSSRQLTVQ